MIYALTYSPDVSKLVTDALVLCDEGKWPEYMARHISPPDDPDGRDDGIVLFMTKVDTAYMNGAGPQSLSLIKLPLRDIVGDPEDPEYVPFCQDVGLDVLAYGEGCYDQVQADPEALAKYKTVLPDREILDEDGNGTGVFEFFHWIEFDAPIRS